MASAETARLIASLELKDNMSKGLNSATAGIGKLEGKFNRIGGIAQKGVSSAITNITRLGLAGGVAIAGAVAFGIRSLADLARTTEQTNAVIASTGGKAGVSAGEVRKLSESLEGLSTVDDKVIQDGANMLLTFTNIGDKVFPRATKAALNMAVAMAGGNVEQVDLKASAIQLGKALNDPIKGITALRKVGVAFTEAQIKQIKALVKTGDVVGAQTIILKELEVEFGNAAAAAGKGPEASWRRLQDVGEDLSQTIARGLLPVLTRAADWLSTKLADPAVIKTIDGIGQALAKAGTAALDFIETVDFKGIADSLGVAVGFARGIVDVFMGMPDWVKTAVITGWGLNKLTGGALMDLGKLGVSTVIEQFAGRGASPAHPLFVKDIAGGLGGGIIGGGKGLLGQALGLVSKVFIVGLAAELASVIHKPLDDLAKGLHDSLIGDDNPLSDFGDTFKDWRQNADWPFGQKNAPDWAFLGGNQPPPKPEPEITPGWVDKLTTSFDSFVVKQGVVGTDFLGPVQSSVIKAIIERGKAAGFKPTDAAAQATWSRNMIREQEKTKAAVDAVKAQEARTTAAVTSATLAIHAIRENKPPVVNVTTNVNVTASQVQKSVTIQNRAGPAGGSRDRAGHGRPD